MAEMTDGSTIDTEQLKRWRLILGNSAQETLNGYGGFALSSDQQTMDEALAAIYDETGAADGDRRSAGHGPSAPRLAKWLGDIRTYFTEDVVAVIQNDAIERKGLTRLLFEPEMLRNVTPDVRLVGTLMALKGQIPEQTRETARMVVRTVVEQIQRLLEQQIRQAVTGALNRREHSPIPHAGSIDWRRTIQRNLKHYNLQRRRLIPEHVYFFARARPRHHWTVIVAMDQSGSMADSVVYGAVTGSIFASLPALKTRVVAFDTEVVDLTETCGDDPVEMLFGIQLGGGTDINKAVAYCEGFITDPARTLFILITDLYEGGNAPQLVRRLGEMRESGVRTMVLLALSDSGVPSFDHGMANRISGHGIPCFGCTPGKLPELLAGALRGDDLQAVSDRVREGSGR